MLHGLVSYIHDVADTEDVVHDLLRGAPVRSETITLPLAGPVDLYAVGRAEGVLAGQLERMRVAATALETFLGTPWPQPATIVLVELESELGSDAWLGINYRDFAVVKETSAFVTYHELAHFYTGGLYDEGFRTSLWLAEGAADFLTFHTLRLTGEESPVHARYLEDRGLIAASCAREGWGTIQEWIETEGETLFCPYVLGRQFLAGLYRALGPAVVSAALRELFESGWGTDRGPTEDAIYQAFLQHTPLAQRDAFRVWYSCLHGRAIPGWIPPAQLPGAAASREVLAALYHATNGPG